MKTKRLLVLWFACCAMCFATNAQLLYEISGNGLSKSSFLFGTHHMVGAEAAVDIPGVFRAFNDCNVVVGEFVDEADGNGQAELERKILTSAQMEMSLLDLLNDEEARLIDSALNTTMSLSLKELQFFRPNVIKMIYEMAVGESRNNEKKDKLSIDAYFQVAAAELGKRVCGLESIDKQADMFFRSKPIEQQVKILVEIIRNRNNIEDDYKKIENLYRAGDIDGLYDLLIESEDMTEAEKFLLVDERNRDWMPMIEKYIKSEACFFAVGALHLPGKEGLINLLQKAGYKVKAVK